MVVFHRENAGLLQSGGSDFILFPIYMAFYMAFEHIPPFTRLQFGGSLHVDMVTLVSL